MSIITRLVLPKFTIILAVGNTSGRALPLLFARARAQVSSLRLQGSHTEMSTGKLEKRSEFIRIIDAFLRISDLKTVSARHVRSHLQEVVGYDLTPVKDEIKDLIRERFDKILAEQEDSEPVNVKSEVKSEPNGDDSSALSSPKAAKGSNNRKHNIEADEKLAAKLHKELNAGRSTRQSSAPQRKRTTVKKKTAKKSKTQVDSDLSSDGNGKPEKKKRAINRNNPFNAPMQLSEPLSELVGKTECSRPECVKSIWNYVKEHGLQDQDDKRYIICDEAMKRVFNNVDRVHMFTMNKLLSEHLFPLAKTEEPEEDSKSV